MHTNISIQNVTETKYTCLMTRRVMILAELQPSAKKKLKYYKLPKKVTILVLNFRFVSNEICSIGNEISAKELFCYCLQISSSEDCNFVLCSDTPEPDGQ